MMQTRKITSNIQNITIDKYHLENEDNFIYLSLQLTKNGNELDVTKRQTPIANRGFNSVLSILKARCIHTKTKLRVYKTVIRPVLSYGAKRCTLTETYQKLVVERF